MNGAVIVITRKNVHLVRMEMKDTIDNILVTSNPRCKLFVEGDDIFFPFKTPHSCKIHEHDTRI